MHNLKIQVGELYRLKIGGGGTLFPRVPPYFDHWKWIQAVLEAVHRTSSQRQHAQEDCSIAWLYAD